MEPAHHGAAAHSRREPLIARPAGGRRRDERTDSLAKDAVLDLVGAGATLSGLSLVTIARQAGVSRNSLYRRWKTKDDLYLDVLGSINRPLPELPGRSARDDVAGLLAVLIERTLDQRASRLLRALNAEAEIFTELHRRYFDEIVEPRRATMRAALQRGIGSGEIRPDVDVSLVAEVLVAPILARMAAGATDDLDPAITGQSITALVFAGIAAS
jgi:AcrR family transcriptional regulator